MTIDEAVEAALPLVTDLTDGDMTAAKRCIERHLGIDSSTQVGAFRAHHSYSFKYRHGGRPVPPAEELADYANAVWAGFGHQPCDCVAA